MDGIPLEFELSPPDWCISRGCYVREDDGLYESLFALTNGRVGVRATVDFRNGGGSPGCFFTDLYGPGLAVRSELVNALHFGYWTTAVDGMPLDPANSHVVEFEQILDLYSAAHFVRMVLRDVLGRTTEIRVYTILPATETDLMITTFNIARLDHSASVEFHSGIDWQYGNGYLGGCEAGLKLFHLEEHAVRMQSGQLGVTAINRGTDMFVAAVTHHVCSDGLTGVPVRMHKRVQEVFRFAGASSKRLSIARFTTFGVGQNAERLFSECQQRAGERKLRSLESWLGAHRAVWCGRWNSAEIIVDGPPSDVEAIRFGLFHLLQAPDRQASATHLPARGLTSEYHSGHTFFNTELYLVPYYAITEPARARALLLRRAEVLKAAREFARATGFDGARYPEEVDIGGYPAAPRLIRDPFSGTVSEEWSGVEVMHLSADVLYGLSRYIDATGDSQFLRGIVLEMVVDIARYCVSLLKHDSSVEGRGARGVMCFDEFHYHVDHHFGTNYLSAWAIRRAADLMQELLVQVMSDESRQLSRTLALLNISEEVIQSWRTVADEVFILPPNDQGVFPQYLGYLSLPDQVATQRGDHRLPALEEEVRQRMDALAPVDTRLIKQADVILLLSLFPAAFDQKHVEANFAFYEPRTVHASSLSAAPHAAVAARLGKMDLARHYLMTAFRYNLDFVPRSRYLNGIHLAGYAGACNALVDGFLGFRGFSESIAFSPQLPKEWRALSLEMQWRGYRFAIRVTQSDVAIRRVSGPLKALMVRVGAGSKWLVKDNESAYFEIYN
ncbi:MAG TPA: glycosyl hydrolase family 65 protein [Chthoniobacterales bacterium]|nr:glycosyl hydrolase family 65 protein [Chthoniobacterales bacterium]